jgi:Bacterial membrane protein YfhO
LKSLEWLGIRQGEEITFSRHVILVVVWFTAFYTLWFLPALLRDQLLGPGDAYLQSLPAYYGLRTLWTTQIMGGFPIAADVTPQMWYPLSFLLSLFPNSWNAFVISSYILASVFSYAYAYIVTGSVLAGLVTGICYGASGFMMTYLSQTSMLHTAAWVPFTLFACEQLLRSGRKIWLGALSIGISCLWLAGHPQIAVYGLSLLGIYAIFFGRLKTNPWSFYLQFIIAVCIGVGVAAIQLLPTLELIPLTPRSIMPFHEFVTLSMPLSHAVTAVFPYILGVLATSDLRLPYIGIIHDAYIYMGLLPLTLAVIGLASQNYPNSFRYFWVVVLGCSFLLICGEITPLAWVTYQIPIYNKFRILTRHSMEFSLSISILAGLGISVIERHHYDLVNLKKLIKFSLILMSLMLVWAITVCLYFLKQFRTADLTDKTSVFLSFGIIPSLVIFALGWIALMDYAKKGRLTNIVVLLLVLVTDLGLSNWRYAWTQGQPSQEVLSPPLFLQQYQSILEPRHQRFFPIQGGYSSADEAPPNFSRLWNASSMTGYGPLLLSRVSEFMSFPAIGALTSNDFLQLNSNDLSFDLAAVRYITMSEARDFSDDNAKWSLGNLGISLGRSCLIEPSEEVVIDLPEPIEIDSIHLVGSLGCSLPITQGSNVAEMQTIATNGASESYFLKAGEDFSESAIDRPDVTIQVKHQSAKVFKRIAIEGETSLRNLYVTKKMLTKPTVVKQLKLKSSLENIGAVNIEKISLNSSRLKTSSPVLNSRWKYIKDLEKSPIRQQFYPGFPVSMANKETQIYENRTVMPRAWLTSEVRTAKPEQILAAVKRSKLPNGEVFNPRKIALIEESITFPDQVPDPNATVQVVFPSETQVRLQTRSTQNSFLVLSDVFYPGWQAHIDGQPAHIFQTNYIFRGVQLPPGEHTVTFSFRPMSFAIGCGISGASLALVLYFVMTDRKPKPQPPVILSE